MNQLAQALGATNEQDFQEKVREFNIGQQNWQQQFQATYSGTLPGGGTTLGAQQQAFNEALQQANATGWLYPVQQVPGTQASGGFLNSAGAVQTPGVTGAAGGPAGAIPGLTSLGGSTQPGAPVTVGEFVQDQGGHTIGKINPDGTITAFQNPQQYFAAGGNPNFSGVTYISPTQFWNAANGQSLMPKPTAPAGGTQSTVAQPGSSPLGQSGSLTGALQPATGQGGQPIQTLAGALQQANLTGLYNGNPTPAYQQELAGITGQFNGQPTETARQFNVNTASDLAKLASSLTGPANYFQYLNALNNGNSILSNLYTGQAQPAGGAPAGSTGGAQSLGNILGNLGLNGNGGSGQSSLLNGIAPQVSSQNQNTSLPPPNQIQPSAYSSMSPSAQQFVQGAYGAAGYNPQDLNFLMSSNVGAQGSSPDTNSTTTSFANPAGQSLFR